MVHDTIIDLDGDYARVACGVLEASPDAWSGDEHDPTEICVAGWGRSPPAIDLCPKTEYRACGTASSEFQV